MQIIIESAYLLLHFILLRNCILKMALLFKNRIFANRFPAHVLLLVTGILFFLIISPSDVYAQDSLSSDIAKALKKTVPCEKIEVKAAPVDNKSGNMKSLLIRLEALKQYELPADFVTVQYTNPTIDVPALKRLNRFKIKSATNCKIGMLVSEKSVKNEVDKQLKRLHLTPNNFSIKFTPPYIEVQFNVPAGAIPVKERNLVEKFIRNKRLEGYAALRLEIQNNRLVASPVKVILNHFLLPTTLLTELKKRINPLAHIKRIRPFDYDLVKVDVLKQHIFLSTP